MTRASDTAKLLGAGATILDGTTISTADNTAQVTLVSTDADATSGPLLHFQRNSSSPADSDNMGRILFDGKNDADEDTTYVEFQLTASDVSNGSEDASFQIGSKTAGSFLSRVEILPTETVFNEDSADVDFRVEGSSNTHTLFVDAGNDQVMINTSTALANTALRVEGPIKASFSSGTPTTGTYNQFTEAGANTYNTLVHNYSSNPLSQYILDVSFQSASPDNGSAKFIDFRDATTARCQIRSDGDIINHDNSYGAISDIKLKEQIADASSQWDDIKALTVRKFKFKTDVATGDSDAHWRLGVIAQEVETAGMNNLVTIDADVEVSDDGIISETDTVTKTVKYSVLYMKAVKALQEAMTRIETLEAKVTTLENA